MNKAYLRPALDHYRNRLVVSRRSVDVTPAVNNTIPRVQEKRVSAVGRSRIARYGGVPWRRARWRDDGAVQAGPYTRGRNVVAVVVR